MPRPSVCLWSKCAGMLLCLFMFIPACYHAGITIPLKENHSNHTRHAQTVLPDTNTASGCPKCGIRKQYLSKSVTLVGENTMRTMRTGKKTPPVFPGKPPTQPEPVWTMRTHVCGRPTSIVCTKCCGHEQSFKKHARIMYTFLCMGSRTRI